MKGSQCTSTPSTSITTLPVSYHGFNFLSIAHINAGIVVNGVSCDLNHHIRSYQTMALIMLMDWTCKWNNCLYLFDGISLQRDLSWQMHLIPAEWVTAHKVLKDTLLSLRPADQSGIIEGDVSLTHVKNLCNQSGLQAFMDITGALLHSLHLKGIHTLWRVDYGSRWLDLHH